MALPQSFMDLLKFIKRTILLDRSPLYNISQYLGSILKNITSTSKCIIKDSYELVEKIKHFKIPDDCTKISLDDVAMFSNIDISLVLELIKLKWKSIKNFTTLDFA